MTSACGSSFNKNAEEDEVGCPMNSDIVSGTSVGYEAEGGHELTLHGNSGVATSCQYEAPSNSLFQCQPRTFPFKCSSDI